jgi:hypothetical protein
MRAFDIPASQVRSPRPSSARSTGSRPLALAELETVRAVTDRPVKITRSGPSVQIKHAAPIPEELAD